MRKKFIKIVPILALVLTMAGNLLVSNTANAADTLLKVTLSPDNATATVIATENNLNKTKFTLKRNSGKYYISDPLPIIGLPSCVTSDNFTISVKDSDGKSLATDKTACIKSGETTNVSINVTSADTAPAPAPHGVIAPTDPTPVTMATVSGKITVKATDQPDPTPALPGTTIKFIDKADSTKVYGPYTIPDGTTDGSYTISNVPYSAGTQVKYLVVINGSYKIAADQSTRDFVYSNQEISVEKNPQTIDILVDETANRNAAGINCDVEGGASWLFCGLATAASAGVEGMRKVLNYLLQVEPLSTDSPTYKVWDSFRNLANVVLVFVFLIIIFGTSIGLDNYTVKKILPKLVIAAIAIQISFFLTGFAIDIGNLLGGGIEALTSMAGIKPPEYEFINAGQSVTGNAVGILALLAGYGLVTDVIAGLSISAIIGAAIAILVVLLTLVVRQVLISLLVITAPLAILAWILPNTDKYYKYWYKGLIQTILLYPIIMLLFMAGRLFSQAVTASAQWFSPVLGLIGYILPLFLVPMAFKAAGSLYNMGANGVGKIGKFADSKLGEDSEAGKARAAARKKKGITMLSDPNASWFKRKRAAKMAGLHSSFFAGRVPADAVARATNEEDKNKMEAAESALKDLSTADVVAAASASDASQYTKRAAIDKLAKDGKVTELNNLLQSLYGGDAENPEWKKAIGSHRKELASTAPQLFSNSTAIYDSMDAEQVAKLSDEAYTLWELNASTSRKQTIIEQIASSAPLQGKIRNDSRRDALNKQYAELTRGAGAATDPFDDNFIATPAEAAARTKHKSDEAKKKEHADLQAYLTASRTTHNHATVLDRYKKNDLYKQAVEAAIRDGRPIPKPFLTDPLNQGEVIIPGDDRSIE